MSETLTQAEYRKLKTRLTRAINSKDNAKILEVAEAGLGRFSQVGYPDSWSRWERAAEDARYALARERGSW